MNFGRKDAPPARPPAPKLSLGKIKGKQLSTGSISIRFNAASMNDDCGSDDEVTIETRPSEILSFEPNPDIEEGASGIHSPLSKSAPESVVSTPLSSSKDHSGAIKPDTVTTPTRNGSHTTTPASSEKSILSGLKEKLGDKIPDPLNALIDKIEEMAADKETSPEVTRDRKLRKGESLDERKLYTGIRKSESLESTRSLKLPSDKRESFLSSRSGSHSRNTSVDSEHSVSEKDKDISEIRNGEKTPASKTDSNSFEIVDDFYCEEPFEDFAGGLCGGSELRPVSRSPSGEVKIGTGQHGTKSTLHKLMKSRDKGANSEKSISMTLSGLLSSNKPDTEEAYLGGDEQEDVLEFFDPQDESPAGKYQTKQPPLLQTSHSTESAHKETSSSSVNRWVAGAVCIVAYLVIPLPSFMSGMVFGASVAVGLLLLYQWWTAPASPKQPFILPDLRTLPPMEVPQMIESKNDDNKFKVWMNELSHYNPDDYHINQTQSVYVQLEGTMLRLQRPKINIPKRAMWDEMFPPVTFIHQRHYDLVGSEVYLLPVGLVSKRLWSKKYPICIALAKQGSRIEKIRTPSVEKELEAAEMAEEVKICEEEPTDNSTPPQNSTSKPPGGTSGESHDSLCVKNDNVIRKTADEKTLYLFARTSREKEEWFRRLDGASKGIPLPTRMSDLLKNTLPPRLLKRHSTPTIEISTKHKRHSSIDSSTSPVDQPPQKELLSYDCKQEHALVQYMKYMSRLMPAEIAQSSKQPSKATSPTEGKKEKLTTPTEGKKEKLTPSPTVTPYLCDQQLMWINAIIGRFFLDFLREQYWGDKIKEKIQRKLSKIHVPYFIDELTVTGIELGTEMPLIRRSSNPYLDDRGMWVDLDLAYNGGFHMSLETKVNLMKLKKSPARSTGLSSHTSIDDKRSPVLDEDEEDSAESSTDEEGAATEELNPENPEEGQNRSVSKKMLRLVDRIAQSKYFQQAAEMKYIKRAMEEVSNTRLMLTVELRSLLGTLAVNIPPPPTDRLWYGFRDNPRLWLSAKPRVGERAVTVTHVTEWIENKLTTEFQRVFVMPNMDDLPIPLMCDHLDAFPQPVTCPSPS